MPQFDTGTSWDQGLNSLGAMLFPDPSKIAQAGHFGALQRNERLKGDEQEIKLKALRSLPGTHPWGEGAAPPPYSAPGPRFPGLQVPRGAWPQAPAGTGVATGGQMPGLAGVVGNAMPGGAPAAPGGLPTAQPFQEVPPYQPGSATQTGQALAQTGGQNALVTGTPQPVVSPAPNAGAPDAPTATGSDGSLPANDVSSGQFHPGSITAPGGGIKMSGPAAADGSPAPVLDLNRIMSLAVQSGLNGDQLSGVATAYINEAYQAGMIDQNSYSQMLASLGRTGLLTSQQSIAQQGMVTGEAASEFGGGTIYIMKDDNTLGAIPRSVWLKNPEAYNVIDPTAAGALASSNLSLKNVFATGPDKKPDLTRTELMRGSQAAAERRMPVPEGWSPVGKDTQGAETGGFQRGYLADEAGARMYKADPRRGAFDYRRQEPAGFTPEAQAAVMERANKIFQDDPKLRNDQKNITVAIDRAIQQMQDDGSLPKAADVAKQRERGFGDIGIGGGFKKQIITGDDPALMWGKDAKGNQKLQFKIDLLRPGGNTPKGPGAKPQNTGPKAQGPNAQLPQAQVQNALRSSEPEGSVVMNGSEPMIVRNGIAVPLSPSQRQQYEQAKRQQGQ